MVRVTKKGSGTKLGGKLMGGVGSHRGVYY